MASKKAKTPTTPDKQMLRVVAVHRDVSKWLEQWSSDFTWSTAAGRFTVILNAIKAGEIEKAQLLLKIMLRLPPIRNGGGVLEYGNNQRGGAPRLFVLNKFNSFFFVAAGLEEGSTGCPEIEVARFRGTQLSKLEPQPSVEAYKKALGPEYDVGLIPPTGTREKR